MIIMGSPVPFSTLQGKLVCMKLPASFSHVSAWAVIGSQGPTLSQKLQHLPKIAVDAGARFCADAQIWVGDGDSHDASVSSPHQFKLSPEKDRSDLGCALTLLSEEHHYRLHFWGLLGGRRDHELFNLGEASNFLQAHPGSSIFFYDQSATVRFHFVGQGEWGFKHPGLFSLGCLRSAHVSLLGSCRYPIIRETLIQPLSSFGLSNEAQGDLKLMTSGPVFIYYPEHP
jgi:thiamine pyrophosphokinase